MIRVMHHKAKGYPRFRKSVDDVNLIIATYKDERMSDCQVSPEKGTVAFGDGLHSWAFNLDRFANIYSSKFGVAKAKMAKRLWGDCFFNAKKETWTDHSQPEGCTEPLPRAFCELIMVPITHLMRAIMNEDKAKYAKMMTTLGIVLKRDDLLVLIRDLI